MIRIELKQEDIAELQHGRYSQLHPRVIQKYNILWLHHKGVSNSQICELEDICNNTLLTVYKQYHAGGLAKLREIKFYSPKSKLQEFSGEIQAYFEENPPSSIGEAVAKIEELTGIKRGETQVRKFLKGLNFRCRRIGTVPAKALTEEKKTNSGSFWSRN